MKELRKKSSKILPKILVTIPAIGLVPLVVTSCNNDKPQDSLNIYLDESSKHVYINKTTAVKNRALSLEVFPYEDYEIQLNGFEVKVGDKVLENNKDYVLTFYQDLPNVTLKIFQEQVINDIYLKVDATNVGPYKNSDKIYSLYNNSWIVYDVSSLTSITGEKIKASDETKEETIEFERNTFNEAIKFGSKVTEIPESFLR